MGNLYLLSIVFKYFLKKKNNLSNSKAWFLARHDKCRRHHDVPIFFVQKKSLKNDINYVYSVVLIVVSWHLSNVVPESGAQKNKTALGLVLIFIDAQSSRFARQYNSWNLQTESPNVSLVFTWLRGCYYIMVSLIFVRYIMCANFWHTWKYCFVDGVILFTLSGDKI